MHLPKCLLSITVIYLEYILHSSCGKIFTLYEGLHTWDKTRAMCESQGQQMLRFKTARELDIFNLFLEQWTSETVLTSDLWMGLFDLTPNTGTAFVFRWTDCTSLGAFSKWLDIEPNNKGLENCVCYTLAQWYRTKECNKLYAAVCENETGCWFTEGEGQEVLGLNESPTTNYTVRACKKSCLERNSEDSPCVAIRHDGSFCRTYTGSYRHLTVSTPQLPMNSQSTVYLKRCYEAKIADTTPSVPQNKYYNKVTCDQTTATSQHGSTTTQLTTTSHGMTSTSDGMTTTPDGLTTTPDRLTTTPDGLTTTPDGLTTTPDGLTTTPDGLTTTPDGMTTTPDGMTTTSDGMTTTPDGITTTPDGLTTTPDGMTTTPDGLTTTPDGLTTTPDGMTTTPDGMTTTPDGLTTTPDGMTTTPDGLTTTPDGMTSTPDGMTTTPDGLTTTPDGMTTTPDSLTTTSHGTTTTPEATTTDVYIASSMTDNTTSQSDGVTSALTTTYPCGSTSASGFIYSSTNANNCVCVSSATPSEFEMAQLIKALILEKHTLSSFRRKKTSAKDDRPSAKSIGSMGIVLTVLPFVVVVLLDCGRVIAYLKGRKRIWPLTKI
ncbi:cell wall protein IFF7-like [Haliotis rufescens]|uniref:cell wall protein IFF7-like n=1 Tax=Haliotis rufescens TaxID=6454 RepID=UPI00201F8FB4|nr:cell wall protein IFF7-like [Haliotis rufescens]